MYYVLGCFGPKDEDRAGIGNVLNTNLSWQGGSRFATPPPTPVEVELNPEFPGVMVPMFDSGILLFSDQMLTALRNTGVDNLDCYEAIIRDPATGTVYTDYKAVNIIGVISCADLSKSIYQAPSGSALIDTDFDSLAVDEGKIRGPLMFRLAECITAILVDDRVKAQLERSGIPYLDFYEPSEWIG